MIFHNAFSIFWFHISLVWNWSKFYEQYRTEVFAFSWADNRPHPICFDFRVSPARANFRTFPLLFLLFKLFWHFVRCAANPLSDFSMHPILAYARQNPEQMGKVKLRSDVYFGEKICVCSGNYTGKYRSPVKRRDCNYYLPSKRAYFYKLRLKE